MELNKIHNINFLENTLPDKCANLIIADPPYFEVKGSFDFVWKSFDDYLKYVEKWAVECKRLLADNGTLFWYGHAKKIAYAQVIFDMHFNLINNLVWDKGSFMGLEESEGLRSFAPCTERILMYDNCKNKTGLQEIQNDLELYKPIRDYFLDQKKNCSYTFKEINEKCFGTASNGGGMASNILTSYKDGWTFPTKEKYEALQKIGLCPKPYEELRKEYEELRKEYEEHRRPFANYFKLQEIFRFSNEAVKTGAKYDHDTVKPETLTRALILTCSRPNDLVVVPFAGSGTECAMAVKEGRKTIGFEITEKHAKMSNDRVQNILRQPSLFVGS
ncbi:MAG TPA: site-specific DNA-methyltransferase [Bacteroidales bacterium]|nr:site-specific DNA-methyltransferase [Bacteroidales bacterium]